MEAATMTNESKISVKVIVDIDKNRVLYAQADHSFVDVLFSFMTLPMGAIVRLLNKRSDHKKNGPILPSLNNLYQSVVDLPECLFVTEECKYMLLNPRSSSYNHCRKLKVKIDDTEPKKYFVCQRRIFPDLHHKFSNFSKARCCKCRNKMNQEVYFENDDDDCAGGGVFVSDITTFIVTDDLCVMPYTPGCCIQLLIDLGVTDMGHLEERTVDLGYEQILDLLGLSLSCNSPLTYLVLYPSRDFIISQHDTFGLCTSSEKKESQISLQVSLQKSTGKLLFAEAEEDFVEFVSGFLAVSLGTVIGTLTNGTSLICVDNIYKSISNISVDRYFVSRHMKDILIKPHFGRKYYTQQNLIFPLASSSFPTIYISQTSTSNGKFFSYSPKGQSTTLNDPRIDNEVFKRTGMFMVTDDLVITPSSSISIMNILSKCNVPLSDIQRHKVSIGLTEGSRMLKASLKSSYVLTEGLEHQLKNLIQNT